MDEVMMVPVNEFKQLENYYKGQITESAFLNKAGRLAGEQRIRNACGIGLLEQQEHPFLKRLWARPHGTSCGRKRTFCHACTRYALRLAADHFVLELDVGQLGVVRASDHP